jgi:hypothetical protein
MHSEYWLVYLMRNEHLKDLDIDGWVILKRSLEKEEEDVYWFHVPWDRDLCGLL